jgi:serine/threonine protein kinase/tetratricopeptide (TPR) repeat protein
MAASALEYNLLFGLLALQNGLINQGQIVAAFQAWTLNKTRGLAEHLVGLDDDDRAAIEILMARHLKKHGDDIDKSLAAVCARRSTRESLAQIGDPAIDATLTRASLMEASTEPDVAADSDRTASYDMGSATSAGQRFRLLRPYAQGGLGAVFIALDTELHREVALKQMLERHADDPTSRRRFLLEAEITGGLEHPGIVPVYGLGTYSDGRPFYAMRLIKGDSFKKAIDQFHAGQTSENNHGERSLELRKLLRRFMDICNAVDYAHGRGVLHRDIKPGNVIVGKHGETLVVDWGLAKILGKDEGGRMKDEKGQDAAVLHSSFILHPSSLGSETLPGSMLGTPAYVSPEQAEGNLEALGPWSDVYSLGATLYCLLTGQPPFVGNDVGAVLAAVRRGEFAPPRQVAPTVDRPLEAVCLKAMARLPQDRYVSSRALAEDVERWMADEPVSAWREPLSRRARRWARRNRTAVAAAIIALTAGVVALGAVAWVQARANVQLQQANTTTKRALDETEKAKQAADLALAEAKTAQAQTKVALSQSEESRNQAEAVSNFLVQAFRSPDPRQDGRQVKVADVLDRACERVEKKFTGSPATKGALLHALGLTFHGLGLYDRAVRLHTSARNVRQATLGPDHPDTLKSLTNLATAYASSGRTDEAIAILSAMVKLREAKLGADHPDTLAARYNLGYAYVLGGRPHEAIPHYEETLKLREARLGPDNPGTLATRNNLAAAYRAVGRMTEALRLYEGLVKLRESKLGGDNVATLTSRLNLAAAYESVGRTAEAIALYEATTPRLESTLGPDHPDALLGRHNLANAYLAANRVSDANDLHQKTLARIQSTLGPDHPLTLTSRTNLGAALAAAGRLSEAIALDQATLKLMESKLDPDHPETLQIRQHLAIAYRDAGRKAESLALLEPVLRLSESKLGPDHPQTLACHSNLAIAYESLGRWSEAERHRREVVLRCRKLAADSPLLANDLAALGRNLLAQSRWSEAEPLLRDCLRIREKLQVDDWSPYDARSLLGQALLGQGRHVEAEPLIVAGYEGLKAREPRVPLNYPFRVREAAEQVVRLYADWGKPDQAVKWKEKLGLRDLPVAVFAGQ